MPGTRPRHVPLVVVLVTLLVALVSGAPAAAAPQTAGGWTTSAITRSNGVTATVFQRGTVVTAVVAVTSTSATRALIDVEVTNAAELVHQRFWDNRSFTAGQTRTFSTQWTVPAGARLGVHWVRVGVFGPGWAGLHHWNNDATSFDVVAGLPTPTTTTTSTTSTSTTTTTVPAPSGGRFPTLPVGAALPSEAECASRVRPAAEIRPQNATFNARRGSSPHSENPRVTGNYAGTTDQILQWAACKWGIDEDLVRAQIARESWWQHDSRGDLTNDQSHCHPWLRTSSGPCPESYGLGQVRYWYHMPAMDNSIVSSAYNVDYVYAVWRDCFEGRMGWLNTVERGREYVAGDAWGCLGVWFSGRWYTQPALDYMGWVREYLDSRIWETEPFINFRG